jgi:hypothetical protein
MLLKERLRTMFLLSYLWIDMSLKREIDVFFLYTFPKKNVMYFSILMKRALTHILSKKYLVISVI